MTLWQRLKIVFTPSVSTPGGISATGSFWGGKIEEKNQDTEYDDLPFWQRLKIVLTPTASIILDLSTANAFMREEFRRMDLDPNLTPQEKQRRALWAWKKNLYPVYF